MNGFVANSFEYGYVEIGLPDLERNSFWDVVSFGHRCKRTGT